MPKGRTTNHVGTINRVLLSDGHNIDTTTKNKLPGTLERYKFLPLLDTVRLKTEKVVFSVFNPFVASDFCNPWRYRRLALGKT